MPGRIIFLLEEASMKELLDRLVPRIVPGMCAGEHFQCIPHQGKTDLERSIPRKLRAWKEPGARFVVIEDNDNRACTNIKARLKVMAREAGRPDTLVRIVCQELESWYLGDLAALAEAFQQKELDSQLYRTRYAAPDACHKPSDEVARLIPSFQKRAGARLMGSRLGEHPNASRSFKVFVSGLLQMATDMGHFLPE